MRILNLVRLVAGAALAATLPVALAVAVYAQAPSPEPAPDATPKEATPPVPLPAPGGVPKATAPAVRPVTPPSTAPTAKPSGDVKAEPSPLIGLDVFGSDGQRIGQVTGVKAAGDGRVDELHVKVGGFLGFGGKVVSVSSPRFVRAGERIQLTMTSDEASKLPSVVANPS